MGAGILAFTGVALGLLGLALHFYVAMRFALDAGHGIAGAVIFYFSFFTIQSNILAVLAIAASRPAAPALLAPLRGARVRAAIVTALGVVSVVYVAALQDLWDPQGAAYVGDIILHYLMPALFFVWWLAEGRDGSLRIGDLPRLLAFPLAYFAYVMARAPIAGEVPYPFLDYTELGLVGLLRSTFSILLVFLGLGAACVLIDRSLGSRAAPPGPEPV